MQMKNDNFIERKISEKIYIEQRKIDFTVELRITKHNILFASTNQSDWWHYFQNLRHFNDTDMNKTKVVLQA